MIEEVVPYSERYSIPANSIPGEAENHTLTVSEIPFNDSHCIPNNRPREEMSRHQYHKQLLKSLFWAGVINQCVLTLALLTFSPEHAAGSIYTLLCLFVWRWMYKTRV